MSKITKTTLKSFVRKNAGKILVSIRSEFDGMVDGHVLVSQGFKKVENFDLNDYMTACSPNYFYSYSENGFEGFRISNCCGRSIIAIEKAA